MSGGSGFDDDIDPDDFGMIEDTSPVVKDSHSSLTTSSTAFFTTSSQLSKGMGYVLVGMFDEARRLCSGTELGDAVVTAITYLEEGNLRKAKELQSFIDSASNRKGIVYCEALWVMAKVYARQEKIRSCKKALAEIKEIDPNYRSDECECLLDALEMLD